jgi:hypothetical protein
MFFGFRVRVRVINNDEVFRPRVLRSLLPCSTPSPASQAPRRTHELIYMQALTLALPASCYRAHQRPTAPRARPRAPPVRVTHSAGHPISGHPTIAAGAATFMTFSTSGSSRHGYHLTARAGSGNGKAGCPREQALDPHWCPTTNRIRASSESKNKHHEGSSIQSWVCSQ